MRRYRPDDTYQDVPVLQLADPADAMLFIRIVDDQAPSNLVGLLRVPLTMRRLSRPHSLST